MILEKNYQLAQNQGGHQFPLLITKEVFNVEKIDQANIDTSIMVNALQIGEIESEPENEMENEVIPS